MAIGSTIGAIAAGVSLGTLYVKLTAEGSELVKGMADAEKVMTGGVAGMTKQLGILGTAAAATFGLFAAVSVNEMRKFDAAMTQSLAIMGKAGAGMRNELEGVARTIATNSITSAEALAKSYFFLASAGLSVQQSIAALPLVEKFAVAGMFDLERATSLLADAQSALGLRTKDVVENMKGMTRVADVLSKANILANGSVEQFAQSLTNKAAAALRIVNKSVEEGVAVLAAYADQGVKGLLAGEQLAIVLRDLQRVAVDSAGAWEHFGLAIFDARGKMRPMADIIESLEKKTKGMSDAQRRATFELLGFQERSLMATISLVGTSSRIREYQKALEDAGGVTEEIANKQLESFNSQLTITLNRIKDLAITFGEALKPGLLEVNELIKQSISQNSTFTETFKQAASVIGNSMAPALNIAKMIFEGLFAAFRVTGIGLLGVAEYTLKGIQNLVEISQAGIVGLVNKMVEGLNVGIRAVNKLGDSVRAAGNFVFPGFGDIVGGHVNEVKMKLSVDNADNKALDWIKETVQTLHDARIDMNTDLTSMYIDQQRTAMATVKTVAQTTQQAISNITQTAAAANIKLLEIAEASRKAVNVMDKMMGVTEKDRMAVGGTTTLNDQMMEFKKKERQGLGRFGDSNVFQGMQVNEELVTAKKNYEILKQLGEQQVDLTKDVNDRRIAMMQVYNEKMKALHQAQALVVIHANQQMFDAVLTTMEQAGARQSGAYKAMFAASKAFAIAESIVKIQQGIANAASLSYPMNIAAMASVVAATANIIGAINSVKLEFDGKREAGGPVTSGKAYLVGERGPEMFVPGRSGNIVPNDQLGGRTMVKVNVNNYSNATAEVTERTENNQKVIDIVIRRVKSELGSEIDEGRGQISRSLESAYKLRRGQG